MKINESYSPVFNRPFVRITDGAEETGDYLFVDIEVRQAIALRDALLAKYPVNNWQPVPATWEYAETKDDFVWTSTITSERNGTHLTIEHTEGDEYERSIDLPEGYALCRLVTQEAAD